MSATSSSELYVGVLLNNTQTRLYFGEEITEASYQRIDAAGLEIKEVFWCGACNPKDPRRTVVGIQIMDVYNSGGHITIGSVGLEKVVAELEEVKEKISALGIREPVELHLVANDP